MAKVEKASDDPDACWMWKGVPRGDYGHGGIWWQGKMHYAHRVSFLLFKKGELPDVAVIRHTCNQAGCVNPDHLIPGTQQENIEDRDTGCRTAVGEENGSAKLTQEQADQIRSLYESRKGWYEVKLIAQRFNVSSDTVWSIGTGRTWTSHTKEGTENGSEETEAAEAEFTDTFDVRKYARPACGGA